MIRTHFFIPVVLAIVAVLALAGEAGAATLEKCAVGPWRAIQSAHFTLITPASEAEGRARAEELERLAETLDRVGWSRRCARPVEAIVFALDDGDCYKLLGPHYQGRPISSAGVFFAGPLGSMMILRLNKEDGDLRVIKHEYVHTMAERRDVALPLAFNEGVADFFSTFQVSSSGVSYGHAIPGYQWILGNKEPMTTDQLLSIGFGSEYYQGENRDLFYAQSWALAHYLLRTYSSETFLRMWDRLADGASIQDAFRATYPQEEWTTLAVRAARFVKNLEDHVVLPSAQLEESVPLTVRPLEPKEVESWLGDLLAQAGRTGKTEGEALYQAALARDPRFAPALAGLGVIAHVRGFPKESAALFARALASSGVTARTARLSAEFAVRTLASDSTSREADGSLVPERWAPVQRALAQALALDPGDDRALELAGKLMGGDSAFAATIVPSLERGHEAEPGQGGIAAALAIALAEAGEPDRAATVLAATPQRCLSPRSADALGAIEGARRRQAQEQLRAGRIEEGVKQLEALRAITTDEAQRAAIDSALRRLAQGSSGNEAVDTYNAGIAAANAGRFAEAIERFEEARRIADDPDLILEAGKRIDELRALQKKQAKRR
jgi:hypothetical protein